MHDACVSLCLCNLLLWPCLVVSVWRPSVRPSVRMSVTSFFLILIGRAAHTLNVTHQGAAPDAAWQYGGPTYLFYWTVLCSYFHSRTNVTGHIVYCVCLFRTSDWPSSTLALRHVAWTPPCVPLYGWWWRTSSRRWLSTRVFRVCYTTKWVISELTALANVVSVDEPVKILYMQIVLAVFFTKLDWPVKNENTC